MKRHQIKMIQTEAGLDKRKEVGLAGLFFWHQLVHYYSALMAHFSTGVDSIKCNTIEQIELVNTLCWAKHYADQG